MSKFIDWYKYSSFVVGVPILLMLILMGIKTATFTTSCYAFNWKCEYAFGAGDGLAMYMGDLLASNPGTDIVAKRK